MTAETPKLRECPFCGGHAEFNSMKTEHKVGCYNDACGQAEVGTAWFATKEEAAAAWNRRAKPELDREMVERIKSFFASQKNLDPEFAKIIDENFWDLLA